MSTGPQIFFRLFFNSPKKRFSSFLLFFFSSLFSFAFTMANQEQTLYEILQIKKDANANEIKASFRRLALQLHPDKHLDEDQKVSCQEQFKEVAQAYAVLSDPQKREKYDSELEGGIKGEEQSARREGMSDDALRGLFEELFGVTDDIMLLILCAMVRKNAQKNQTQPQRKREAPKPEELEELLKERQKKWEEEEHLPVSERRKKYLSCLYTPGERLQKWKDSFQSKPPMFGGTGGYDGDPVDVFEYDPQINSHITVWWGDIHALEADGIIVFTDQELSGDYSQVTRGVHDNGSVTFRRECRALSTDPEEVRVTLGHCLPARYVIHVVWEELNQEANNEGEMTNEESSDLKNCIALALRQVMRLGLKTIGFSCDIGGRLQASSTVICRFFRKWMEAELCSTGTAPTVIFCCTNSEIKKQYERTLRRYFPNVQKE